MGTSKNFVACYIEKRATAISNLTSKTAKSTVKRGQIGSPVGWGGTADDDRGCYDPVLLSILPFSNLNLSKSMLTFFDITYLYLKIDQMKPPILFEPKQKKVGNQFI